MKHNDIIKIFFSIILALIITQVSSRTIFMSNTPRINKSFIAKIIQLPGNILNNTKQFIASISFKQPNNINSNTSINQSIPVVTAKKINNLPLTAMQQLSKGVYAYRDTSDNILYIKVTKDMEYEERVLNYNGKQIKLRFPKGTFK
jgi:hypothetical protein